MRWLALLLLLAQPAGAVPYPSLQGAKTIRLIVSPYTEDPTRWTPRRVHEAIGLVRTHMSRCNIDVDIRPLRALRPGDALRFARLWRTDRKEEMVVILRAQGDVREYRIAGVANLRTEQNRWVGEAAWTEVIPAIAREVGGGGLRSWPKPTGPTAAAAVGMARMAVLWTVAKGWLTTEPTVAEVHCKHMRKNLLKNTGKWTGRYSPKLRLNWAQQGVKITLPQPPSALFVADTANRNAVTAMARVGKRWWFFKWGAFQDKAINALPAHGQGQGILQVGGATLLVEQAPKGVLATWWHQSRIPGQNIRQPLILDGCERVLAMDVIRPAARRWSGDADPGTAIIVCPNRVFQLTPLFDHTETSDKIPSTTWATLTRWGPGRTRLITQDHVFDVRVRDDPELVETDPRISTLRKARPQAPIWHAPGSEPVQLGTRFLYGIGQPRPLGDGATAVFNAQMYRMARVHQQQIHTDDLYGPYHQKQTMFPKALWATHRGDHAPMVWLLEPKKDNTWAFRAPGTSSQ